MHCLGPYSEVGGRRWRVRVVDGRSTYNLTFATESEALRAVAQCNGTVQAQNATIGKLLALYLSEMAERTTGGHCSTTANRLRAFFIQAGDIPIGDVTVTLARQWYADYRARPTRTNHLPSVDTHRNTLSQVKTFGEWCVDHDYVDSNPFTRVKGFGKRSRGKAQLTLDEARKLSKHCLQCGSPGSVAVLTLLWLGLRASELTGLEPRDVGTDRVYIRNAKTQAGDRTLLLPAALAPLLRLAVPFGGDRHWLKREVSKACSAAGVPVVTPHGLRGTHASLAKGAAVSGPAVASALGHSSEQVTRRHYYAADVEAQESQKKVLTVLSGGRKLKP